mgnify:CR=1 FL=1
MSGVEVKQDECFTHDEVALMRFMEMCQESCDPDSYGRFVELAHHLISIRPGLRSDCFNRINTYMGGTGDWSPESQSIGSPAS